MKKKLLIVVGIVVVVVVVGCIVLVTNLGRVVSSRKDAILARVEAQVGRKVTVDDIKVGVWPSIGVSLENVTIADDPAFSPDPFVHVGDLRVNVKLLPLLHKRVEVKRLVLGDPTVNVIIDADGQRNFDSMVAAASGGEATGGARSEPEASGAAATALVLAYADIDNGRVHIVDRARGIDRTVGAIHFTARNVSLDQEMSFELSAAVAGEKSDTKVEGKLGPLGKFNTAADLTGAPLSVTAAFGPVDGAALLAALPAREGAPSLEPLGLGDVAVTLAVRGTLGDVRIEDVVASAAVLGEKETNATLRATVSGINAVAPGGPDPTAIKLKGDVRVDPVPVAALARLAPAPKPPKAGAKPAPVPTYAGTATANVTFDGGIDKLAVNADVDAAHAVIDVGDLFHKRDGDVMRAKLDGLAGPKEFEVTESDIRFHDLHATATGVFGAEAFDVHVESDPTDVSKWRDLVPALAPFAPTGKVSVRANVSGTPKAGTPPEVTGTLELSGGGATLAQLPKPVHDASATVTFSATSAQVEKAEVSVGRSVIRATADVSTLEPLKATYRVTADRVFRDDVQAPTGAKPAPRPEVLDNVVAEGTVWQEAPEKIGQKGKVTSQKGVLANLDYTDLVAAIHSDGDAIVIDRYSARLLDGNVEGDGRVEPLAVPPRFDITTHVKQVNIARYFDQTFPALGKFIEGRIDLDLNVAGAGKTWEEIAKTLSGKGDAIVVRGALVDFNVADELLGGLASAVPLVPAGFMENLRSRHPKVFATKNTAFEDLKGNLAFDNGRMNASDLVLKTADFSISGNGWFAFDRTMDLNSTIKFSPRVSADIVGQLPVAKYLLDDQGRFTLPMVLSGDVTAPQFSFDTATLTARFRQSAVDEGRDKLKGQLKEGVKDLLGGFGKKKETPPDTSKTRKTP